MTIHYAGRLTEPKSLPLVLNFAKNFAGSHQWEFQTIETGGNFSACGFVLFPHPDCEPLRFEFGPNFKFESWVKTQFAGPQTHIDIVDFLKQAKPIIGRLGVRDEGEFWETGSEEKLRDHMDAVNRVIADFSSRDPQVRTRVGEADGRITDQIQ